MISIYVSLFLIIVLRFFLSFNRFLNCLIVLEKFNVLLLLFCLIISKVDNHMIFIALMVVSTIEIVGGLTVLTRVWECSTLSELEFF